MPPPGSAAYVRRRQKAHYSVPSVKPFFFILYRYGASTHGDIRRFCAGSADSSCIWVIVTTRYLGSQYSLLRYYSTAVVIIFFSSRYRYHISISRAAVFSAFSLCVSLRSTAFYALECDKNIQAELASRMTETNSFEIFT